MQYLTIDEVLAEAMSIVKDKAEHEGVARQWIWTNLMQTGVSEDELEVTTIKPKNLIAKKPKNCRRIKNIALFDSAGGEIPFVFRSGKTRMYYPIDNSITTTTVDGEEQVDYGYVDVSEDRFNIVLGTNATDVDLVAIRYYSLPLDASGDPMVQEVEKLSCIFYVRWMIALRQNENQSQIQLDEIRWKQEVDRARAAKKSQISEDTKDTIAREWLRHIPSYNHRKF
jgi:hypothetical protein